MLLDVGSVGNGEFYVERNSPDCESFVFNNDLEVFKFLRDLIESFVNDSQNGTVEKFIDVSSDLRRFLDLVARHFKDSLTKESAADNGFGQIVDE